MGRPDGKRVEKHSLAPVVSTLEKELGTSVNQLNVSLRFNSSMIASENKSMKQFMDQPMGRFFSWRTSDSTLKRREKVSIKTATKSR